MVKLHTMIKNKGYTNHTVWLRDQGDARDGILLCSFQEYETFFDRPTDRHSQAKCGYSNAEA